MAQTKHESMSTINIHGGFTEHVSDGGAPRGLAAIPAVMIDNADFTAADWLPDAGVARHCRQSCKVEARL